MGRKMNNMPKRKKRKDPNNKQIRGKAGFGRLRAGSRLKKMKEKQQEFIQLEKGIKPLEESKEKERGRPEGYLAIAKRQEDRVSADVPEQQEQKVSKKRKRKEKEEAEEPKTDLLERSRILPRDEIRMRTIDLSPGRDDDVLAKHEGPKKQGMATYCPSFCSSGVCFREPNQGEFWPRASVHLVGLQAAPELNGRTASCSSWDSGKERWLVKLEGSEDVKALKASNLRLLGAQDASAVRPGSVVRLVGLDKKLGKLNGEKATCLTWERSKARWIVRMQNNVDDYMRPENLQLFAVQPPTILTGGASVQLSGLQAAPELNGKLGKCISWDEERQRWLVKLAEDDAERLLKPENLEVESVLEGLIISPSVKQTLTFCSTEEKMKQLIQFLKTVRQEEKKGLRPRNLMAVFCKDEESVKATRLGLVQAGHQCVMLYDNQLKAQRDSQLENFQLDKKAIAIVTDGASYGLKSDHLTSLVNFDFPRGLNRYGDRIKRVLRDGIEGWAHSLFTEESHTWAKQMVSLLEAAKSPVDARLRELAAKPPPPAPKAKGKGRAREQKRRKVSSSQTQAK